MTPVKSVNPFMVIVAMMLSWCLVSVCNSADLPKKGAPLPPLQLNSPLTSGGADYLGIGKEKLFQLGDVKSPLVMVEILGIYCPQCHKQRPIINRIFNRVQKDPKLSETIKFVGIAVGATPMEVTYLVEKAKIPYPVITDEKFDIHKLLGEPRTPFNMVVNQNGKVLWIHSGIIENVTQFFSTLKSLEKP